MPDPVFVLLHGAWHSPQCWSRLIAELENAVAPSLPSCGSTPPTPDWTEDVQVIRSTVSGLVVERDVVVVMHSFSGMTGGTALEGLDKEACSAKGLQGGVKGTVTVMPEDAKGIFYQDIYNETVEHLVKDLRPQSLGAFWSTTDHAAWSLIPTTYVLTLKDKPSTVAAARHLVDTAKASGTHRLDKVIELETGHSPFISYPESTTRTLIEEATRSVALV
ncbi:hypothetical protein O1611_g284 [Lasiodiplodia mahajangana]|uniref:Uncharacterized protein n=1 Tax=Lasiodiplodia mahajangana TaxID=1108764 RepID=A0ACC2K1L4_9PEZI|nr:hypothetical protein O1611_g284 [Lasiodiplodia mahajangana]